MEVLKNVVSLYLTFKILHLTLQNKYSFQGHEAGLKIFKELKSQLQYQQFFVTVYAKFVIYSFKTYTEIQRSNIYGVTLEEESHNKIMKLSLPNIKNYYKATVIKTLWC